MVQKQSPPGSGQKKKIWKKIVVGQKKKAFVGALLGAVKKNFEKISKKNLKNIGSKKAFVGAVKKIS